jgi:hypothetical protein
VSPPPPLYHVDEYILFGSPFFPSHGIDISLFYVSRNLLSFSQRIALSLSLARARAVLPGFAFSLSAAAAAAALSCRSVLGFTVVVGACSGGPVSGGAFNPAVGFG